MMLSTRFSLLVVAAIVLAVGPGLATLPATVRIDAGLVSGVAGGTADMRVFKGIPFAAPPVGPLRWRPPQPVKSWAGVRQADQFGARCMQPGDAAGGRGGGTAAAAPTMSEDCLSLNVWTEAASASERRPVIVWSHGGAFTIGYGIATRWRSTGPKGRGGGGLQLPPRAVRLFPHPELTKESERNASGNYGLMDLVAVLRWVQQNITAFGGDPNRVTLMGQSAGGLLIRAAVASAQGKGLFHRAISQSAPVRIERMLTRAEAEKAGQAEAAKIGAATLAALRAKPADEIQRGMQAGRLVVDGWYVTEDISITDRRRTTQPSRPVGRLEQGRGNVREPLTRRRRSSASRKRPRSSSSTGHVAVLARMPARFWICTRQGRQMTMRGRRNVRPSATKPRGTRAIGLWHRRGPAGKAYLYYFVHEPPVAPGQPNRGASHTARDPVRLQRSSGVMDGRRSWARRRDVLLLGELRVER